MKTNIFKILPIALVISGCVVVNPPAATVTVTTQTQAPPSINLDTASTLKVSASLQSSEIHPICSWTKDGQSIWVRDNSKVDLYNTAGMHQEAEYVVGANSVVFDVSPDGKTIAYSQSQGNQEIMFLDIFSHNDVLAFPVSFPYENAFFSPDGSLLGVASLDEIKVYEYNVLDGTQVGTLSGFTTAAPVYSARYAQDGKHLLWWSRAEAQPMDLATGNMGPKLSHEDFISALSMSLDGTKIATAAGGTINGEFQPIVKLWNASNGSAIWEKGNPGYFNSLDFSLDGSVLAAGDDGEVVLYDVKTGDEIVRLPTGNAAVDSLGFSPDGTTLVTCDADGNVALWKPD